MWLGLLGHLKVASQARPGLGQKQFLDKALLDLVKDTKKSVHALPQKEFDDSSNEDILHKALKVERWFKGTRQHLQFIAKTHVYSEVSLPQNWISKDREAYKTLILGSPFYVAEA